MDTKKKTYKELMHFLENKMSMSHIYQPLLIRSLVESDGSATIRQLAQYFLAQDESQLLFYEKKIKEMPLKILKKHGIASSEGNLVSLNVSKLSFEQKAAIRKVCETKLQEFIESRGLSIWDYRLLETDPLSGSLRNKVLAQSDGRCELCGATKKERPLDVDHIIPRAKGGTNNEANLQVLCSKCNRAKRDKDDTDFRNYDPGEQDPQCPFCVDNIEARIHDEHKSVYAIESMHPVTDQHMLVIPKRHTTDFFSMTKEERNDADGLIRVLKNSISLRDAAVTGFNVGMNCGEDAGQTIMHAHIHLIPRRRGDVEDPRGGVRGVIPAKMSY